jgi:hypothetical protein
MASVDIQVSPGLILNGLNRPGTAQNIGLQYVQVTVSQVIIKCGQVCARAPRSGPSRRHLAWHQVLQRPNRSGFRLKTGPRIGATNCLTACLASHQQQATALIKCSGTFSKYSGQRSKTHPTSRFAPSLRTRFQYRKAVPHHTILGNIFQ